MTKPKPLKAGKPRDLTAIFSKFAGLPLKDPNRMTCDIDGVLSEMTGLAAKQGIQLRVLFPGKTADFGHNPNRVNVIVDTDSSGKMKVGRFTQG